MRAFITTVPERALSVSRVVRELIHAGVVDRVTLLVDYAKSGPWANARRGLAELGDEPALVLQDDIRILTRELNQHWPALTAHLETHGLVSLFAPPRKSFSEARAAGFNFYEGNEFLWGPMYLIRGSFARQAIEIDKATDQSKVGYHDEVRFRLASQYFDIPMLTVTASFCQHDLKIPSTLGTGPSIGGRPRDTRELATMDDDFSVIRARQAFTKADLAKLIA